MGRMPTFITASFFAEAVWLHFVVSFNISYLILAVILVTYLKVETSADALPEKLLVAKRLFKLCKLSQLLKGPLGDSSLGETASRPVAVPLVSAYDFSGGPNSNKRVMRTPQQIAEAAAVSVTTLDASYQLCTRLCDSFKQYVVDSGVKGITEHTASGVASSGSGTVSGSGAGAALAGGAAADAEVRNQLKILSSLGPRPALAGAAVPSGGDEAGGPPVPSLDADSLAVKSALKLLLEIPKLVRIVFADDPMFVQVTKDAFSVVVNQNFGSKSFTWLMAVYCDNVLKVSNIMA
jgi:hypothetical protein